MLAFGSYLWGSSLRGTFSEGYLPCFLTDYTGQRSVRIRKFDCMLAIARVSVDTLVKLGCNVLVYLSYDEATSKMATGLGCSHWDS